MKKVFLTGAAALFLATGTAHTQELDIHHGENVVMLLLEKADGQKYVGMLNTQENCRYFGDNRSTLESRKRNVDNNDWSTRKT